MSEEYPPAETRLFVEQKAHRETIRQRDILAKAMRSAIEALQDPAELTRQRDILAKALRDLRTQSLIYRHKQGFTHDFPASVHDGAERALREAGLEEA